MSALLSWLKPYEWVIWLICIVLVLGSVWGYGHYEYRQGIAHQQASDLKAVVQVEIDSPKVTLQVITNLTPTLLTIETSTNTIIQKVPTYVTAQDHNQYGVPNGFVSLWNDTNQMHVPDDSAGVPQGTSNVTLSDIATQHARETGICLANEATLDAMAQWLIGQQKVYEGKGPN